MPGYVMAYAWADLMGVAGPLQSVLRETTGWSARDYWFPNLFSAPGLAFVLASTLFPYVYITARAAFTMQSLATLEAARSLGTPPLGLFWKVGLPVALPAILGGVSLALMEAAADYGAADFLGIQTLGVGIVRSWTSFGEPNTAARLALVLILIAGTFLIVSRTFQGQRGSQHTSQRWLTPRRAATADGLVRRRDRALRHHSADVFLCANLALGLACGRNARHSRGSLALGSDHTDFGPDGNGWRVYRCLDFHPIDQTKQTLTSRRTDCGSRRLRRARRCARPRRFVYSEAIRTSFVRHRRDRTSRLDLHQPLHVCRSGAFAVHAGTLYRVISISRPAAWAAAD